jgi:hypothetical protein
MQKALPYLITSKGNIVNVSSVTGKSYFKAESCFSFDALCNEQLFTFMGKHFIENNKRLLKN